ncbi:MAG: ATP-dependent DNA helicase [Candidatus Coatesbacteria bacterium]|nr:ATP-dependent DNA helicase [Candidatus Coatesbacteria bacterium]
MADIASIFGRGGPLARTIPDFEQRPDQAQMAKLVWEAIQAERHLIVEAGTGIGKSLAYLIPVIASCKKAIVSTKTKTLQEQLLNHDIPLLQKASKVRFTATCLKGRGNYLCRKRFEDFESQPLFVFPHEIKYFHQIQDWARRTSTGDRSELHALPDKLAVWADVCSQRDLCTGQKCASSNDCFLAKAREAADKADVVVINHHLFFANLALQLSSETSMLPERELLVFDEAHDIEQIASQFLGVSVGPAQIGDLVSRISRQIGIEELEVKGLGSAISNVQKANKEFFGRFTARRDGAFKLREDMFDAASVEARDRLCGQLLGLAKSLSDVAANGIDVFEPLSQRCRETAKSIDAACDLDDMELVHWAEAKDGQVQLKATPICLADTLARHVFAKVPTVILTSATLSSERSFKYIKSRLGTPDPLELMLNSSFDFRSQALLYIPKHLPLPDDPDFVGKAATEIVRILKKSNGRAFVLCTSNANMNGLHELVGGQIDQHCFIQGEMPNPALLEKFRQDVASVLFATASFWQGVDVQGEALSCVIVDKLPFAVPTDPIIEARIERIRSGNGSPFDEFQVPQAVIGLKQGFGRLIRTKTDRGVLSILDRRILQRAYGRKFLESLPPCPLTHDIEALGRFFS